MDNKLGPILAALPDLSIGDLSRLAEAVETARQERAVASRRALVEEFQAKAQALGLSLDDLVAASRSKPPAAGKKVAAKYRGPNGEEWAGRGRAPTWLTALEATGRTREEFLVASA